MTRMAVTLIQVPREAALEVNQASLVPRALSERAGAGLALSASLLPRSSPSGRIPETQIVKTLKAMSKVMKSMMAALVIYQVQMP